MIKTILKVEFISLRRDRIAQLLTFLVPIVFFSIFAMIFGGQSGGKGNGVPRVSVVVADMDQSTVSKRFVEGLKAEKSLNAWSTMRPENGKPEDPELPVTRERAEALVRNGNVSTALIIPPGWGKSFVSFGDPSGPEIELLADVSNPVAPQLVGGLMQKVVMTAAPDLLVDIGFEQFEKFAGELTPYQRDKVDSWKDMLKTNSTVSSFIGKPTGTNITDDSDGFGGFVRFKTVDLFGEKKNNPVIAFYAAGIGVMFLLFSCSGASGSLLEDVESGTLERLLTAQLGMTRLLIGKWLFLTLLGIIQLTVMFTWGALVFKMEFFSHLPGFFLITIVTSAAAAGLSLVLATACKSRGQLSGVSTLVILSMSALGGSMIPRFMMSETMQKIGLITFNGWALDGYIKVFWREEPLLNLWPQVTVLTISAVVFMLIARALAKRWETV